MKLYKDVGCWEERLEKDIEEMLKKEQSVGAWKGNILNGFGRAVTDEILERT